VRVLSDNKKELLEDLATAVTLLGGAIQATHLVLKGIKKLLKHKKRPKPKHLRK
jgi:hypothetical protein